MYKVAIELTWLQAYYSKPAVYCHYRINVGWSTLGTRLSRAEKQMEPTGEANNLQCFSEDETSYIESVVQRAEAEDEQDAMRIKYVRAC